MIVWSGFDGVANVNTGGRYDPATDTWMAMSTVNAPSPRNSYHGLDIIWTGTRMIVWGGWDGSNTLDTGGQYDPVGDTWTATSTTGAPVPRTGHIMVWTGSEMLVWSGYTGSVAVNYGARYDPSTDTWAAMTTTAAPVARYSPRAVWTGSEMVIWGGYSPTFGHLNTGGRYNLAQDTWTATTQTGAPGIRSHFAAVWTGTEMIVWGGTHLAGQNYNDGGRYNPSSNSWVSLPTAGAPAARHAVNGVWTGSEMIVWGGWDHTKSYDSGGRYNPTTNSWTATAVNTAPTIRYSHATVWTGSEMIVWGGYNGAYLNTGGRYDPVLDNWLPTTTTAAPSVRGLDHGIWTGTEMIVWGGSAGASSYLNTGGRYNPVSDSWTATSTTNAPVGRTANAAVWTGSKMIVWGGKRFSSYLNSGGLYDPVADSWMATPTVGAPSARYLFDGVWSGSELIIWGGWSGSAHLITGGRYDPVANSWTATATAGAPAARHYVKAIWEDASNQMLIWGGYNGAAMNDGALYDPTTNSWSTMSTSAAPSARFVHSMVWTGKEVIVWGGWNQTTALNTGARYDVANDSWTAVTTVGAPGARYLQSAVWTGTEMLIWAGYDAVTGNAIGDRVMYAYYPYSTHSIGGSVSGLATGNTVVLQNNAGDDLALSADASFTFDSVLLNGSDYAVTVLTQPTTPNQTCTITNASGTLTGANVTNVVVACITNTYSIGGNVTGLASGNSVVLQNNSGDDVTVSANSSFSFSTELDDESGYSVSVLTQPTTPNQTCTITSASGTLAGANVTDVAVTCITNKYSIGGTLTGLASGTSVVLQNNNGDDLTLSADGVFEFSAALPDETVYAVTVLTQPAAPDQQCTVAAGSGTLAGANISNVAVTCLMLYQLNVNIVDMGSVSSSPAGISACTNNCAAGFADGTQVTLTATPTLEWTQGSWVWSGDCTGNADCVVDMAGAKSVTATFFCDLINIQPMGPITGVEPAWNCFDLNAGAGFDVQGPSGEAVFEADNSIMLNPGFRVRSGAKFRAVIY
jgi:N-acetylneuraminic acid mutarotase